MKSKPTIKVFEHRLLKINQTYNGYKFEERHYEALSKLNILHDNKYFETRHDGIKFKEYVGVIQVDGLTIEILPKIDNNDSDVNIWQKVLIDMLRLTKKLKVQNVGHAHVSKQQIHLLDIYFEWFLNEVQLLIHQGLIKQYYKETGNVKALKGKLEFAVHIQKNLVHKERFYTTHQVYDKDHLVHQILAKALAIVEKCSKGSYLYSKCKTVQLDFPEVQSIAVTEATFSKIPKSRKTAPYETALDIARLIILNFAPNITSGKENMLALLFDMNTLWEEYILARLKSSADSDIEVLGQRSKLFWNDIKIRPDIVITKGGERFVIDTKWKNINGGKPSTDDLRQMYVYNDYWKASKSFLLYPSNTTQKPNFTEFEKTDNEISNHHCGLGKISILNQDGSLNPEIGKTILEWIN